MSEFLFLLFAASLFLKLGSDTLEHPQTRIFYLVFLVIIFLLCAGNSRIRHPFKSSPALFFLFFFGFEVLRLLWAVWLMEFRGVGENPLLPLLRYVSSPVNWLIFFGFFLFALSFFRTREQANRLLWWVAWMAFILAMAAIPPLLLRGHLGYPGRGGGLNFFPPFFYFNKFFSQYVISRYAHPNDMGDLVALGFFPATGLFFYFLQRLKEGVSLVSLGLPALFLATEALAIILFFSRGTIVCFSFTFLLFLLATLVKYPSRLQLSFAAVAFTLIVIFFLWAGNVQATWKELQTLKRETTSAGTSSSNVNREGAKRALTIYRALPLWGAGTGGYAGVSPLFSTVKNSTMSNFKTFCHYLQVLCEEGVGAYLYFLFILAYFFEWITALLRTNSRFQFMAGLSLGMPVLMIYLHAAVSPIMDYFAMALPVYIYMGLSLGVLQKDFEHG